MAAVRGNELVIARGEGIWRLRRARATATSTARRASGTATSATAARRSQTPSARQMRRAGGVLDLRRRREPARARARRAARARSPDGRREGLLHDRRRRRDRHRGEARPAVLAAVGQPERVHIISRTEAYHGTMAFGTSIGGIDANRVGYGPLVPSTSQVPCGLAARAARGDRALGAERVAAFFVEPVIGAGRRLPPPPGYIEEVAEICRETGVLFVVDAVIAGSAGSARGSASSGSAIEPDLVTFAKGVTSGYLPLGGVVVSGHVAEPFWSRAGPRLRPPRADVLRARDGLRGGAREHRDPRAREPRPARARARGRAAATRCAAHRPPLVGEVRGGTGSDGGGGELEAELLARDPALPGKAAPASAGTGSSCARSVGSSRSRRR